MCVKYIVTDLAGVGPALSALIERWRRIANQHEEAAIGAASVYGAYSHRECANELEAALKALSGSVGGLNAAPPWQPMETAPKTSKHILVWTPENLCTSLVVWSDTRTPPRWEHAFGGSRLIDEPSHWMPLPASPVCAAEKKA